MFGRESSIDYDVVITLFEISEGKFCVIFVIFTVDSGSRLQSKLWK